MSKEKELFKIAKKCFKSIYDDNFDGDNATEVANKVWYNDIFERAMEKFIKKIIKFYEKQ